MFYILASLFCLFFTATSYCNIVWPALFVGEAILSKIYVLMVASIIIEALVYYWFLAINYQKAFIYSIVGNIASTIVGTHITVPGMFGWHFFTSLFVEPSHLFNVISTWILMFLCSALIELLVVKLISGYSAKKLLAPILIGNLATYILAFVLNVQELDSHKAGIDYILTEIRHSPETQQPL